MSRLLRKMRGTFEGIARVTATMCDVTFKRSIAAIVCATITICSVAAQALDAQQKKTPNEPALLLITTFAGPDSALSSRAASMLREKIAGDAPSNVLRVVPADSIDVELTSHGFPPRARLLPIDAIALARLLRASQFIEATIRKTGAGYSITAFLQLSRDGTLRQPLGAITNADLKTAIDRTAAEVLHAQRQIVPDAQCSAFVRTGDYTSAINASRAGIAAYPRATIARMCLANALQSSRAPTDSILKTTREVLRIDSANVAALRFARTVFGRINQLDSVASLDARIAIADPRYYSNAGFDLPPTMQEARRFADSIVKQNPADPELLKMRWLLLFTTKDYRAMRAQGVELARIDPSFADSIYYKRTAIAFVADSQLDSAAAIAGSGLRMFPKNSDLAGIEIVMLSRGGHFDAALSKLDAALAESIAISNAGQIRVSILSGRDGAAAKLPAIRSVIAAGDTSSALRQMLIDMGSALYIRAQETPDTMVISQLLTVLSYADSVSAGDLKMQVQLQLGAGNLMMSRAKKALGDSGRSCTLLREAREHVVMAQTQLTTRPPAGSNFKMIVSPPDPIQFIQMREAIDGSLNNYLCDRP